MKRSEVNQIINEAIQFFEKFQFKLPPWAYYGPQDWKDKKEACQEIFENKLGWDITDFGLGKFKEKGLVLFTIRNGNLNKDKKVYCEKIMISDANQECPMHFHWFKYEDIINRGGGDLVMQLFKSDEKEGLSKDSFEVKIDGIKRKIDSG